MTETVAKENMQFQTEVNQLLQLMIHSLYSNKEIFLRELISNASDACDKLRFNALSNDALYENDAELRVEVECDSETNTVTIRDNGIGMTRDEVISHIGTIAKSGTKDFFSKLTGDEAKDSQLIGQFGVGFYSAFIVADKVVLRTRKAGTDTNEGVVWESAGDGQFSLETEKRDAHGTSVTLHLKETEDEFLEDYRLRNVVTKYSDHIVLPIVMQKETKDEETEAVTIEDETINSTQALWQRGKSDIKDEEYNEFYKSISHDYEDPMLRIHNRVEGNQEYTSLLFIPARAPFDLWDRQNIKGVKLYVRRIFIMDDAEHLLPPYLRFVRGIIDSSDLPLNVSREILQSNKQIDQIRNGTVKKVLGALESLAKKDAEKYAIFWEQFGKVLKEGVLDDASNRERIAKLLRFASTHDDKVAPEITLPAYVERMKEGQEKIYYVTAESFAAAKNSPHLEIFRKKGIEVILLHEQIDEWLVSHLTEFDGKQLQSVTKGDLDLGSLEDEEEKQAVEKINEEMKPFIERLQGTLEGKAKGVRVTHRLTNSPACLVADGQAMDASLERMLKAAGQAIPDSQPILEINPEHPLIIKIRDEADEDRFKEWGSLLFDQSLLSEGAQLDDPAAFIQRMNNMLL
jgi:molecular chaperone HtpG